MRLVKKHDPASKNLINELQRNGISNLRKQKSSK